MPGDININIDVSALMNIIKNLQNLSETLAAHLGHAAPETVSNLASKIEEEMANYDETTKSLFRNTIISLRYPY